MASCSIRGLRRGLREWEPLHQTLEHAQIADRGEDQILVADVALCAKQLDRFEHVVEIVGRFAHAHEYHLAPCASFAREHPLGDDLGAAELAQQTVAATHAEDTPHGTTNLR